MAFFNRKEEVLDIQLTQFGKHSLSKGIFKPVYYAFFDDDLVYDHTAAGVSESQNSIEDRIKETLRLKTQYVFHGIETEIQNDLKRQRLEAQQDDSLDHNLPKVGVLQQSPEKLYSNIAPLGTAELGEQKAPRWQIVFLKAPYTGSVASYLDSELSAMMIPQIEVEILHKTEVVDPGIGGDEDLEESLFGSGIKLDKDFLMLEVQELNGFTVNSNFTLEVFEIETETIGRAGEVIKRERLKPLPFVKTNRNRGYTITDNNILKLSSTTNAEFADIDELNDINLDDQNREFDTNTIVGNPEVLELLDTSKVAESWFDILVDKEIPTELLCELQPVDKTKGIFSKRTYVCEDLEKNVHINIYGAEEEYEDPCEE